MGSGLSELAQDCCLSMAAGSLSRMQVQTGRSRQIIVVHEDIGVERAAIFGTAAFTDTALCSVLPI